MSRHLRLLAVFVLVTVGAYAQAPPGSYNVRDYGVVGDGVANDTVAIQALVNLVPARSALYFPRGAYKLTATVDAGSKGLSVRGDGKGAPNSTCLSAGASCLFGNFAGPLWKVVYPASGVEFLDLQLANSHATGTALHVGGNSIVLERLSIAAYRGIWAPQNTFTVGINNVQLVATPPGWPAGSIGIMTGGHSSIRNVDIVGYDHAIRAVGIGVYIGSTARIEVNKVGLALGLDENGVNGGFLGATIESISLEANGTAVLIYNAASSTFQNLVFQGSANAPGGMSAYGLQVNNCSYCEFHTILANGNYTGASVRILNQYGSLRFTHVIGGNGLIGNPLYPAAKLWDTPPGTFVYEQTNRP